MTPTRPWASAACLAGRPHDCPRTHTDGRRCANPAHDAYPDALKPAGEQPTLDVPVAIRLDVPVAIREAGTRVLGTTPPTPRRRRWRCDRCDELVHKDDHTRGGYACEGLPEPPTDEPPWHNHAWQPMDDARSRRMFTGKAFLCPCGATMDDVRVYDGLPPELNMPDVGDQDPHDALERMAAVVDYKRPDGPRGPLVAEVGPVEDWNDRVNDLVARVAKRQDDALATQVVRALRAHGWIIHHENAAPVTLTAGEVKRIGAAHLSLDPRQALDVVRTILTERRAHPGGAP